MQSPYIFSIYTGHNTELLVRAAVHKYQAARKKPGILAAGMPRFAEIFLISQGISIDLVGNRKWQWTSGIFLSLIHSLHITHRQTNINLHTQTHTHTQSYTSSTWLSIIVLADLARLAVEGVLNVSFSHACPPTLSISIFLLQLVTKGILEP